MDLNIQWDNFADTDTIVAPTDFFFFTAALGLRHSFLSLANDGNYKWLSFLRELRQLCKTVKAKMSGNQCYALCRH